MCMHKYILVTGAGGFIGSHLCEKLVAEGYHVIALNRSKSSKNANFNKLVTQKKITHVQGDITTFDFNTLPNVEYIFHIAGKVSVWGKLKDFMHINYNGTKRLLQYAKKTQPKCFIYFSTVAVYGFYGYTHLKEDGEKKPFNNPYSISKLKTEALVQDLCANNNQNFVIVRPANVYGEYDYTASYEIFSRIKKENMMICAKGKYLSCFVYVKNLVDAVYTLGTTPSAYNTDYNISDGNNETLHEMFTAIAHQFAVKPRFTNFPAWMAKSMAHLVEFFYKVFAIKKAPLITKFSVYQNCNHYNFSIEKLKSIGYTPKYSMTKGIKNTCNWINKIQDK